MKQKLFERFWKWCGADFFSPKDFVRHAILILLIFGVFHVAGLREYTSFLNGTTGSLNMNPQNAALLGLLYLLIYMAAILLAPILLIAAAISAVWQKLALRNQAPQNESGTNPPKSN
jgi:phosphotransferase system  glucose/maltose/N-acetylglucosamine-specific IIC component